MNEFNLPVFSLSITFSILFLAMTLRYFILAGLAYQITKNLKHFQIDTGNINPLNIRRDIFWSIFSTLIFSISGTLIISLWQNGKIDIYSTPHKYGWFYFTTTLFILLFIHDSYFYWTHRLLHTSWLFKKCHKVHHESLIPTAWTAFSFHPSEAILQAIALPLLLIIFPVHWFNLISFLLIMTILGIINHLGFEFYPLNFRMNKPFSHLISATHHQRHHKKFNKNFGLYFNWWDIWMKTEDVFVENMDRSYSPTKNVTDN
jgi:Delta7-sterol 5-desaturase